MVDRAEQEELVAEERDESRIPFARAQDLERLRRAVAVRVAYEEQLACAARTEGADELKPPGDQLLLLHGRPLCPLRPMSAKWF